MRDNEQLKIELLSQWKLEAEFRNFVVCILYLAFCICILYFVLCFLYLLFLYLCWIIMIAQAFTLHLGRKLLFQFR